MTVIHEEEFNKKSFVENNKKSFNEEEVDTKPSENKIGSPQV